MAAAPKSPRSSRTPPPLPAGRQLSGRFAPPPRGASSVPPPVSEDSGTSSTRLRAQYQDGQHAAPVLEHADPSPYHLRPEESLSVDWVQQSVPNVTRARSLPPALELWRKELVSRELASRTQTHFEVLGVTETDDELAVTQAFEALATRFDPTALPEDLASLQPQAEKLFLRIGRAYDTLRNPESRRIYEHTSKTGPLARSIPPAASALQAEGHMRDAELALRRKDYPMALLEVQRALRLQVCARHEALYAWVLHLSSGAPAGRVHPRALSHIDSALRRDGSCVEAHQYKALMHKHAGEGEKAHAHWKRVLRLAPGHLDAAREVRLWDMRNKGRTHSGLIERIFGRKPGAS